jgi:hypothetical protein
MKLKKNNKIGGDGYVINVNESIGGMPAHTRYSNNYRPVFNGELLQNGGDGYSVMMKNDIGGEPIFKRYTYDNEPIFNGSLLKNGGGGCGCNSNSGVYDPTVFELIKQQGGKKINKNNISQFYAIQKISNALTPLSTNSLIKLNLELFFKSLSNNKTKLKKVKQLGGYVSELESIIAPLGKNNLLVLASLLLLHYFAVERIYSKDKKIILSGGDKNFISNVLDSVGLNKVYTDLQDAFNNNKKQEGGNPLKNLIAPLGTNAFIATGLLIILEKLFTSKMKELNSEDNKKKILIGGKINKKYEELFNLIAPVTFNIFAKKSFLDNVSKKTFVENKNSKK